MFHSRIRFGFVQFGCFLFSLHRFHFINFCFVLCWWIFWLLALCMHFHYKFIHLEQAIKSVCNNFSKSFFLFHVVRYVCSCAYMFIFLVGISIFFSRYVLLVCIVYYFSFKQPKHIQLSDFIRWVNNKSFLSSSNRAFDSVHTSCAIVFDVRVVHTKVHHHLSVLHLYIIYHAHSNNHRHHQL